MLLWSDKKILSRMVLEYTKIRKNRVKYFYPLDVSDLIANYWKEKVEFQNMNKLYHTVTLNLLIAP